MLRRQLHETIQKVGDDYGRRHTFNTAIAAVMELLNALSKFDEASPACVARCARKPSRRSRCCSTRSRRTPRTRCGRSSATPRRRSRTIAFPEADPSALVRDSVTLAVQVNGKLRGTHRGAASMPRAKRSSALALAEPNVQRFLEGMTVRKVIVVPGKIVNIVAG